MRMRSSSDSHKAPCATTAIPRNGLLFFGWRLALPIAVLAAVWIPHFSHFWINHDAVPAQVVQLATRAPTTAVLDEISGMALGVRLNIPDEKIPSTAEQILKGSLPVPRFSDTPFALHGYPMDYQRKEAPTLQLIIASLEVERVLLNAFEQTNDQRFLDLAVRRTLDFAVHEAGERAANGNFLWNDHAVASRISVLIKLWRFVRLRPDFPASSSIQLLSLVERSGRLLAKPNQFTVRTNHGVAQNVALLQITAAFPVLPESNAWRKLAVERLNIQLPFYVSKEGVVLEHSAGYQLFGMELLAMAVRLDVLNGLTPAPLLVDAARNSQRVLATMMRPDGTLPLLGNTSSGSAGAIVANENDGAAPIRHRLPPYPPPALASNLFPVVGVAIWWKSPGIDSKRRSETLITWAKHDGHGHKHADEGSVLFWSDGVDWITNTGYWPYGARNSEAAYAWTGSNAPHQPGEEFSVPRSAHLLYTGAVAEASFIEVERRNTDGAQFRRQILQIDPQTLLVLDFSQNVPKGSETIWTVDPMLRLLPGSTAHNFISSPAPDGRRLAISYVDNAISTLEIRRGSEQPFAGWVVKNNKPTRADALRIVNAAAHSVSAVLFQVSSNLAITSQKISIQPNATVNQWDVLLDGDGAIKRLSRSAGAIRIDVMGNSENRAVPLMMPLQAAPDVAADLIALKSAYANAINVYPPWRELSHYRLRVSYALAILALLAEAGWFLISRLGVVTTTRQRVYAHAGVTLCWIVTAVWVLGFYLR